MKNSRLLLIILLPLFITACSTMPAMVPSNQAYLEAEQQIKTMPQAQYRILDNHGIYIGEFKAENAAGFGKIISPDGSVYQGSVLNGKAHGFGKSTMSTGETYEGEHNAGIFEGRGRLILSDGSAFIGLFKDHKVHKGEMFFTDGSQGALK